MKQVFLPAEKKNGCALPNTDKSSRYCSVLYYVFLYAFSFLFLAFFSYSTSPFTNCDNGSDSAFFRLVGQGMVHGYLPYRDFFDMKGPFLFFIEFLGQRIRYGRWGIFLIQTVSLFLVFLLISALYSLYGITGRLKQAVLLLPVAWTAAFTFEGGNLTEELSLVPLLSSLYLCLSYFYHREEPGPFWQKHVYACAGAWFGVCFGVLLMIRVTNAALLGAMGLAVTVHLLAARKLRPLLVCVGTFFVGFLASTLPFVLYYASRDLLGQMLEALFILGFKYSGEQSFRQHLGTALAVNRNLLLLLPVPCAVVFLLRWRGWRERLLVLTGTVFTFLAVVTGNNFAHYYALTLPLVALGVIPLAESFRKGQGRRFAAALLLTGIMLVSQWHLLSYYCTRSYYDLFRQDEIRTAETVRDVSDRIPAEDATSVFCYNLNPSWYTYAGLFPCNRYCGWQNHYISLMPEIYDDLKNTFETQPPRWLVLPVEPGELPDFIERMLDTAYRRVYENDQYTLFCLETFPA